MTSEHLHSGMDDMLAAGMERRKGARRRGLRGSRLGM